MTTGSPLEHLADVPDPRDPKGRVYPFVPLLALCLVATLAGCTGPAAMSQFGRLRGKRLGHALGLTRGKMPCPNALADLPAAIDADALDRAVGSWLAGRHAAGWGHVAIDGKAVRGSRDGDSPAPHLPAADAPEASAVVAQMRVEATTNEHQAALRLLGVPPPLAGAVVTADALFTRRDFRRAALDRGGDDVLYAEDNQATLRGDIKAAFDAAGSGGLPPQAAGRLGGRPGVGRVPA